MKISTILKNHLKTESAHSLSKRAGLHVDTIYKLMRGDRKDPRHSTVKKIENAIMGAGQ